MASVIPKILKALNSEVITELELARSISHPGESGRAREKIIENFFRRLIPKDFDISTGFVIDAHGGISKQMDIVIYRTNYHPVFEIGGIKHFMVESVAVVIQNKASIQSVKVLQGALDNIRSVKKLDKSNGGKNRASHLIGGEVDVNSFFAETFGAIAAQSSMTKEAIREELLGFLRSTDRSLWPNMYVDVNEFMAGYLTTEGQATANPRVADRLGLTDVHFPEFVAPLLELAFEVVNFLRVFPVIDFLPTDYVLAGSGKTDWTRI
jgi:hypothetical protein